MRLRPETAIVFVLASFSLPIQAMTLSEALQRSVEHDPAVPLSMATYEAEKQLGTQVTSALRPSIGLDGIIARNRNQNESQFFGSFEETYNNYGAGITARQSLLRFDWKARKNQATALDNQADAGLLNRKMILFVRVAERYFAVLNARQQLALVQAEARAVAESLEDTQKRYDVGLIPGTDLKEALARNDLASARMILVRQQLATARDALDESTGHGHAELPELPEDVPLPALQPASVEVWVQRVRQNNPEVLLAKQAVVVAESQAQTARSDIMPSIDAVASYRHDDSSDSRIGSERDDARIGLELYVPIYQGGIGHARIRELNARLQAAQANHQRIQAEVERETRQKFRELLAAYAQVKALAQVVASATAAEQATKNGYEAGTRTITDVLNASSAVISAKSNYAQTRHNLLLDRLRLKQLAAELKLEDFVEVDSLMKASAVESGTNSDQIEGQKMDSSES